MRREIPFSPDSCIEVIRNQADLSIPGAAALLQKQQMIISRLFRTVQPVLDGKQRIHQRRAAGNAVGIGAAFAAHLLKKRRQVRVGHRRKQRNRHIQLTNG